MRNKDETTSSDGARYKQNKFKQNNFKKGGQQKEKFKPEFKKRVPTWKKIEDESKELVAQYETVC